MSRAIRVLTIGHSYVIARNRSVERAVAADPGFDITVASPQFFHGDLRPLCADPEPVRSPLTLITLRTRRTRSIHLFGYDYPELKRIIRDGRFDLVHAWEEPYIYAGYQIAAAASSVHTRFSFRTAQSISKRYLPPFAQFERAALRAAYGWLSSATLVYELMLTRGYPAERGRRIPLAVDLTAFRPVTPAIRNSGRQVLGLHAPVVGFMGRLVAAKGLDVLMRAMELLDPKLDWTMLLPGSGEYETKIRVWADRRGWRDRVHVRLVNHEDVPYHLGLMDVLVAPSQTTKTWKEQFGRMLVEAFAVGVPVIASDSGEIPFVVGQAGIVVPERDASAFARAITVVLRDPARRDELARRGLERAKLYSAAAVAEAYKDFYRWVVTQPRSSGIIAGSIVPVL